MSMTMCESVPSPGIRRREMACLRSTVFAALGGIVASGAIGGACNSVHANAECVEQGTWTTIGVGLNGEVRTVLTFDDGKGPATYVAGDFTLAGGVACNRIARWDGHSWAPVGLGFNAMVHALEVHDDGTGPTLYAAGEFTASGPSPVLRIARWSGTDWEPVGAGFNAPVLTLESTSHDEISGLYAGGEFLQTGNIATPAIARWDGSIWSSVGNGLQYAPASEDTPIQTAAVFDMVVHDLDDGPRLVIGGRFSRSGDVDAIGIAQWNGKTISSLGSFNLGECYLDDYELLGSVKDLAVLELDDGPTLMAAVNERLECGPEGCGCMGFGVTSRFRAAVWSGSGWTTVFQRARCTTPCICDFGSAFIFGISALNGTRYLAATDSYDSTFCDGGGGNNYWRRMYVEQGQTFQVVEPELEGTLNSVGVFDRITAPPVLWISGPQGFAVLVCDDECPADLDTDGSVGGDDLSMLLAGWGTRGSGVVGDIVPDGVVDGADLSALLSAWGACE